MAGGAISIGAISADLEVDSGKIPQGLAAGEQAINAFTARIKQLDALLAAGAIGKPEHVRQVKQLSDAITDLAGRMQAAHASLGSSANAIDLLNAKMQAGASSSGRMGMALMQVGAIADDIQYGFQGVVNNILPLVMGLTGNAGIAAAAQIAAVAVYQLSTRWDQLRETMGDSSGMEAARQTLKGMTDQLEKLQADADNFSWGERLTKGVGGTMGMDFNPDAGAQAKADVLAEQVAERKKATAVADKIDSHQTDTDKAEQARFVEAVGEHDAEAKRLGLETAAEKVARRNIEAKGAGEFLDDDKGAVRGLLGNATTAAVLSTGAAGGAFGLATGITAPTPREEYEAIQAKEKSGQALTGVEAERKRDLENQAKRRAMEAAREQVGRGGYDRSAREDVAGVVGGRRGDMIRDQLPTDKDAKDLQQEGDEWDREVAEARIKDKKATADAWEKEAAEREKQVKEIAAKADPRLAAKADRLAREIDQTGGWEATTGEQGTPEGAVQTLKRGLKERSPELTDEDAEGLAREQFEKTKKDDPEERAERIKADNLKQLKRVNKNVEHDAESAVALTIAGGGDVAGKLAKDLKERLMKDRGMDEADAEEAVGGVFGKAQQKVSGRLKAVRGDTPERERPSHSEVYSTSDLTHRVQAGVSDSNPVNETKKTNSLLEKQNDMIQKILEKPVTSLWVTD